MTQGILVIGGGITGIQASLDLADKGLKVYLVEKEPTIGGKMAVLDKTFPTNDCSICILAPKMNECASHSNIELLTYSEVKEVMGSAGDFNVKILKKARYIDEDKCVGCGVCVEKCPSKVPNKYNENLDERKAVFFAIPQSVPPIATIDKDNCLMLQKGKCGICQKVCPPGAVDYEQKDKEIEINVGAIIAAIGFDIYNPSKITEYRGKAIIIFIGPGYTFFMGF